MSHVLGCVEQLGEALQGRWGSLWKPSGSGSFVDAVQHSHHENGPACLMMQHSHSLPKTTDTDCLQPAFTQRLKR